MRFVVIGAIAAGLYAGLFAGLLWALQPAVLRVAVNGLETAVAIFFLLCLWIYYHL